MSINLTKSNPTINLKKQTRYGLIKANLNWNQQGSSGFLGFGRKKPVDLDLGAFVRFKTGHVTVVQALGESFGDVKRPPYVALQDDDRTGFSQDGEWLHINGDRWEEIDEILIFTFIYEGVPSWNSTDAVVTINVPGQNQIITRLDSGMDNKMMCAIAQIKNNNDQLTINRLNQYFHGHKDMDEKYGWGFNWRNGSK